MHVCMSTQKDKAIEKMPWSILIRLNINCYIFDKFISHLDDKREWNRLRCKSECVISMFAISVFNCIKLYLLGFIFLLFLLFFCFSKEIQPKFYHNRSLLFFILVTWFSLQKQTAAVNDSSLFKIDSLYFVCTCISNAFSSNSFLVNHIPKKKTIYWLNTSPKFRNTKWKFSKS